MIDTQGESKETWDRKKILIALLLIAGLVFLGYKANIRVLGTEQEKKIRQLFSKASTKEVKGNTSPNVPLSQQVQSQLQQKVQEIKDEISKLDTLEVASSSPQVQKILKDIKALEEYPKNQAKEMCQKICSGI